MEKITAKKILKDFKVACEYKSKWIKESREDVGFALGKHWSGEAIKDLEDIGVLALTINKIHPIILTITGLESQNRTDYHAFPKGEEDSLKAEVTTNLLKHVMQESDGEFKQSEQFDEGIMAGECYLEPYLDYTSNMINPDLKWKKVSATQIFPSPKFMEYDLSDAKYCVKFSAGLTKDDILSLYPDQENKIKNIAIGTIDTVGWNNLKAETGSIMQRQDNYQNEGEKNIGGVEDEVTCDLIEYYYRKMVKKTYIVDFKLKRLVPVEDETKAQEYINTANMTEPGSASIRTRYVPEIWMAGLVGNTILHDDRAWSYPRWPGIPFIPYFAYRRTADIKEKELLVKGVVRDLKDLNRELNKRRTQELRHLNQSANSGWEMEEGAVDPNEEENYRKFGASPGTILKHKQGRPKPEKIIPTPLSQGHAQVSMEREKDIKEVSGINSDLLAMNESQASGRAIHLRTKQGLLLVQKLFDNNTRTKKMMGKFIISQLGEIFDTETVAKIMGEKWVLDNFGMPIMRDGVDLDPETGQPTQLPILDETGKPQLEMTEESIMKLNEVMNVILNDLEVAKYDVAVGEGVASDTIKFANFLMLQEMVQAGIPIPPDVMVDESTLSGAVKDKIKVALEKQMQAVVPQVR